MAPRLKIVGVHGLGDHRDSSWREDWRKAVTDAFPDRDVALDFDWISYDDIFEGVDLTAWQTTVALGKLIASGVSELFGARKRGFFENVDHTLKWYAGYVVAWVENQEFQERTRARVIEKLLAYQPDVLLAHSLGSLVTYNALSHRDWTQNRDARAVQAKLNYVTLGSQLANPFVVNNLAHGRIEVPPVKKWFHLYNPKDKVFTAPIRLPGRAQFEQIDAQFDFATWADHDAKDYLSRPAVVSQLWKPLADAQKAPPVGARGGVRALKAQAPQTRSAEPRRRALLVGINDYPDPAACLEGCVNDVFLMSELLQECQFQPEQIRICLNDRATAQGIRERLEWLVADAGPGDELVFFYSGHGAQLATYGDGDAVDHKDETLVPYDFDWTPEHSVVDDQIFNLYSQLPYDTRLVLIFDCCHSGGIHRSGSRKGRGLEPPDDIRHRSLRWNYREGMWEDRPLRAITPDFAADPAALRLYCGTHGDTRRLGRAMSLRGTSREAFQKLSAERGEPVGPYLPLILEACQEGELASEYRHGNESYGAFTYSLAKTLRTEKVIAFTDLVAKATAKLRTLGYEQTPQILGPSKVVAARVPWLVSEQPSPESKPAGAAKPKAAPKKKAAKKKTAKKK